MIWLRAAGNGLRGKIIFSIFYIFLVAAVFAAENTEETDFIFARKAFNGGFYDITQGRLEALLKNYPNTARLYEIHSLLARCHYSRNDLTNALYEFDIVLNAPAGSVAQDEALYWTGEIYFRNGDYKKSLELYQRVIDEFPSSKYLAYSVYSKGWAYYKLGFLDDAGKSYREVFMRFPYEKAAGEAQFRAAECEYLLGRYANAGKELRSFIEKFPVSERTAEAYYLMGEASFYQAKYKDSVTYLEKALSVSPNSKWVSFAAYRLASALFYVGDYQRSSKEFEKLLENGSNDFLKSASLLGLAQNYEKTNRLDESQNLYDRIIRVYPDNDAAPEAYYRKAKILSDAGKYAMAETAAKEAIEKYPKSRFADELHYELGWAYNMEGKSDEALGAFLWVENESKDINLSASSIAKIGDIYFDRKDYKKAIESYDMVLDKYPDSFIADYAQYQIGNIFFVSDRYDEAALAYQTALANFPNTGLRGKIIFQLGASFFKKGDFERAASQFTAVLKDFQDSVLAGQAKLYLANSLYSMGSYDLALPIFGAIEKGSQDKALKAMARYQAAWCYYNMGRDDKALDEFNGFLKDYPDSELSADAAYWLGDYYSSKGKFDKAGEYYSSILKNYPSSDISEDALYQAAITLHEEGKIDEAVLKLEEVTVKYPGADSAKMAYRKIARIKKDNLDFDATIENLRKAMTGDNNELNAQTQYEIAECVEAKGDLVKATEEYLKVPYIYSKGAFWSVRAQLKCAKIFEALDKLSEAKSLYEKLADMDIGESEFAKSRLEWIKWRTAK
ncbi:MAG: tetratricopeptide repeat protein [Candidatus Omnitrophota bacterium]|nr:tetratricopeptide repeat protein [Candidatus Omnitrophota bacterium]